MNNKEPPGAPRLVIELEVLETIAREYWLKPHTDFSTMRGIVRIIQYLDKQDPEFLSELERKSLKFMWIINGGKEEDF